MPGLRYGWIFLISLLLGMPAQAGPLVKGVSFSEQADGQGYVVRIQTSERVNAYRAPQKVGERQIEFVLYNAQLAPGYAKSDPEGPVQSYSVRRQRSHLFFQFQLKPGASVSAEAYRDRSSSDLLVSLTSGRDVAPPTRTASASEASGRERWEFDTVVLDAGHGGHDPGAQAFGFKEKDIVLNVTRKVGQYIEKYIDDVEVVYTRKDDRFVPLRERGRIANRAGAKLFVSIHANASRSRRPHGTETYFLGMHKTETARKVMKRENSVIQLEENPEQYKKFKEQPIKESLAQSMFMGQSEQLAGLVQEQFEERVGRKNRGVKQAGFLVLWAASMPAVLIETGFLTNAREAAFLSSDRGQTYLASAIFRAIRSYKKQYDRGLIFQAEN